MLQGSCRWQAFGSPSNIPVAPILHCIGNQDFPVQDSLVKLAVITAGPTFQAVLSSVLMCPPAVLPVSAAP